MEEKVLNQSGFNLLEVLIALMIFAVFATAFVQSQGTQVGISSAFPENLKLRSLAMDITNDLIVNTPDLSESLFVGEEEKTFEDDPNYQYSIRWEKFELPDFSKLKAGSEENPQEGQSSIEAKIMEKVRENMAKLIYQVEVTIKNKISGETYTTSAWIYNTKAKVDLNGF